jgi:hypothetical protein
MSGDVQLTFDALPLDPVQMADLTAPERARLSAS